MMCRSLQELRQDLRVAWTVVVVNGKEGSKEFEKYSQAHEFPI